MKLGTNDIGSVYLGTNAVQKVYLGANEVWSSYAYLLDDYSGAAAAYSLRKLRSAYTGDDIRVRRASDNTELDIGFVNNELDTSALTTFCSGTNGFVKTWYDQSGNAYDVTQTTSVSQPQIVSSGSVILENTKPTANFDGSNDLLTLLDVPIFSNVSGATLIAVNKCNSTAILGVSSLSINFQGTSSTNLWLAQGRVTAKRYETGGRRLSTDSFQAIYSDTDDDGQVLITNNVDFVNTTIDLYQNTNLVANSTTFQTSGNTGTINQDIVIGSTGISRYWNGNIQEIVIYPSDQSSNRTGIETNINSHYGIY